MKESSAPETTAAVRGPIDLVTSPPYKFPAHIRSTFRGADVRGRDGGVGKFSSITDDASEEEGGM